MDQFTHIHVMSCLCSESSVAAGTVSNLRLCGSACPTMCTCPVEPKGWDRIRGGERKTERFETRNCMIS